MPYIKKEQREQLDNGITSLLLSVDNMPNLSEKDRAGILNYIISELVVMVKPINTRWNYDLCNKAIGVFECAKLEFYRRKVAPYEDTKIEENGDIGTYE